MATWGVTDAAIARDYRTADVEDAMRRRLTATGGPTTGASSRGTGLARALRSIAGRQGLGRRSGRAITVLRSAHR